MKKRNMVRFSVLASLALAGTLATTTNHVKINAQSESKAEEITYTSTQQKRNVMYYGDWSIWGGQGNFYPKDIPADQLTHLNFAFLDFDAKGNLIFTDKDAAVGAPVGQEGVQWGAPNAGILIALQELRAQNPNLKLGISVGGWSKSADFPLVAADEQARKNFVDNLLKFIEYTNMDFIDIDWEFAGEIRQPDKVDNKNDEGNPYASEADKELYIKLLEDLRAGTDKLGAELGKEIELTVALPAPKAKIDAGIDVARLFDLVDFANIMSYDMRGAWDPVSGHQSGLYANDNDPLAGENHLSVDESVNYLIEQGAAPDKIVIGAAFYTRGWDQVEKGDNPELPGLFQDAALTTKDADLTPSYGATPESPLVSGDGGRMTGIWSYRNIDKLKAKYPGLTEYWDDVAKAPYLYDEKTGMFFTYDNVRSITEKADYVNENELGGMIAWMQSQDAPTTSTKRDELTNAMKDGLFGAAALPEHEIVYSDLDIEVSIKPYKENWGTDPNGYEITIKNNERLEESDAVLKELEIGFETIKAPKLYIKADKNLTSGGYGSGTITHEKGYTVVDLSSVWEGKNIEPGKTYTLKLKGEADIEAIHLVQRMSTNGPEMYPQTIYGKDTELPEVNTAPTFAGLTNATITVGEKFDALAGVSATDKEDGDLTKSIKVSGTVDVNKAGTYTLTYSVTDSKGSTTTVKRQITVEEKQVEENTAPTFKGLTNETLTVGDTFDALAGVSATDKEDGDLTKEIKVSGTVDVNKAGTYTLTYSVTDSKGLTTTEKRQITVEEKQVEENTAPTFKGLTNQSINVGEAFDALAGVTATDKEDGDLTKEIKVSGTVDVNKAGTYTLTYSVTDSKGLTTTEKRQITVEEKQVEENTAPTFKGLTNQSINVGEAFDALAGVTATDKEDGDLTKEIKVSGTVDVNKAGTYTLTYSVTDSKGLKTTEERVITVVKNVVATPDFGVGEGIEWPQQVNAPYVDMVAWVTKPGYSNNGAANLGKIMDETGVEFYNLGFIQSTGGISDNKVNWGWGGHAVLSEKHPDNTQYQGIKKSITDVRQKGGDVTISLGGLSGTAIWEVTQDVEILANTYREIVEGYGLTRLDLDIEGAAQNKAHNVANAKAIKKVQDETGVAIVLTLPVLPAGLTSVQLDVLEAYLSEGVDVELVNIMTMCYGNGTLLPGENYGTASLRAVDSTKVQLQTYFKKYAGIELTDDQAYKKVGTTISAGFEGSAHPIFTTEWAQLVVDHAIERGIGMTSFWSLNRDAMLESNQGVNTQYEFTNIFKSFGEEDAGTKPEVNNAPKITGASDITITVGENFDVLEGVAATDKEDGNLTANIKVVGEVNTDVAGTYTITYSVTDSQGLTTTVNRVVTVAKKPNAAPVFSGVENKSINLGESFDILAGVAATDKEDGDLTSKITVDGSVDTTKGGTYTLTYSVTDSEGVTTTAKRVITVVDPNGDTFDINKVYNTGDTVIYNGAKYTAKWWVKGEYPNKSQAWEKIVEPNEDGPIDYEAGMVFNGGELVKYEGKTYRAKWWTNSTPGSDSTWELVSDSSNGGSDENTPEDGVAAYVPGTAYTGGQQVKYNEKVYEAKWWTNTTPGSDDSWKLIN